MDRTDPVIGVTPTNMEVNKPNDVPIVVSLIKAAIFLLIAT